MTPFTFRRHRLSLGFTQARLAELLGYRAPTRICEIEAGSLEPSKAALTILQALLDGWRPEEK